MAKAIFDRVGLRGGGELVHHRFGALAVMPRPAAAAGDADNVSRVGP